MQPTNAEVVAKFDAHEKRDEDRFESQMAVIQTGFKTLGEKIEDVKNDHLLPFTKRMDAFANRLEVIENKHSSLSGCLRLAAYFGIPIIGIILGVISWQSLSIININTQQAAIKAQSDQLDSKILNSTKQAVGDYLDSRIESVTK